MANVEHYKRLAAEKAVDRVKDGMILGLGTGTSAKYATLKIGQLWQSGALKDIIGIPTSKATEDLAQEFEIPLGSLADHPVLDLVIDGADEITPDLDLIKGLGGALLREKMIEVNTKKLIIVADGRKLVQKLGTRGPLSVEVTQFEWKASAQWLEKNLDCQSALRGGEDNPFVTDNHNFILDCTFANGIDNPAQIDLILNNRPGIVEHGLFLGMATEAIIANEDGVKVIRK